MGESINGEVTTMLDALGQGIYDQGGLGVLGLLGPTHEAPTMVTAVVEVPGL